MPAYQYLQSAPQEDTEQKRKQLTAELAEAAQASGMHPTYFNKLRAFMEDRGIWHLSGLDYPARAAYENLLKGQMRSQSYTTYIRAMDLAKLHSIKTQFRAVRERGSPTAGYRNEILFLPYHPDPEIAERFINANRRDRQIWDFGLDAPERMKRQIFDSLHYIIGNYGMEQIPVLLRRLKELYGFCIDRRIDNIDGIEPEQAEEFGDAMRAAGEKGAAAGIIDVCRRALFVQSEEIRWDANVWYMERLHLQPERLTPSNPIKRLSFLEVTHKGNQELLKKYMRYGIGATNLSVSSLRREMILIRKFLSEIGQDGQTDAAEITEGQMDDYFRKLAEKEN